MLKIYGFARVNKMARGNTRDLRVLWAAEEMGLPYEVVADILMTHVLASGSTEQALLEPYSNIVAYRARCTERPAWKKTLDAYLKRVEAA